MVVPRYSTGALIARFLIKKLIVFALATVGIALFIKNPLTYGYPWLIAMFILWCVLDIAGLYGDVKAYAELNEELSAGRDPQPLVEAWLKRDTILEKVDGLILAVTGAGLLLLGFPKWMGSIALVFGLMKLVPFIAEADSRDIDRMVAHTHPPGFSEPD